MSTTHDGVQQSPASRSTAAFRNEPLADFAEEENRRKMRNALGTVRSSLGERIRCDRRPAGRDIGPHRSPRIPRTQPRSSVRPPSAEVRHVNEAVAAAARVLPAWWLMGARGRAEYLLAAAEVMRERRFELAAWEVFECGKQWREADADVCEAIDFCEYYAQGAIALDTPHEVNLPGEENRTEYLPRGVAGVIAPWNFPLAILTGMTGRRVGHRQHRRDEAGRAIVRSSPPS